MLIDLHTHTTASPCSSLELDELVRRAVHAGLGAVCVTDHDTTAAAERLRGLRLPEGFHVFVGMEYTTPRGDLLLFGPRLPEPGLFAEEALVMVRKWGGAAVLAHPGRAVRGADEELPGTGLVDAVEVENGRNTAEENLRSRALARACGLPETGGSDAHTPREAGTVPTWFPKPVRTLEDLVSAIRSGTGLPVRRTLSRAFLQPAAEPAYALVS